MTVYYAVIAFLSVIALYAIAGHLATLADMARRREYRDQAIDRAINAPSHDHDHSEDPNDYDDA